MVATAFLATGRNEMCNVEQGKCHRLYKVDSQTKEDCRALRMYKGCLNRVESLCQANLRLWSSLATTKKVLQERCSQGDTFGLNSAWPVQRPQRPQEREQLRHQRQQQQHDPPSSCVVAPAISEERDNILLCGVLRQSFVLHFQSELQLCGLRGTWPLVHTRFLTVQVTAIKVNTSTVITQVTVLLRPDRVCLKHHSESGLQPAVIYEANSLSPLPQRLSTGVSHTPDGLVSLTADGASSQDAVHLSLRHLGTDLYISRSSLALSVLVLIPPSVAASAPHSLQQARVRSLCRHGCPLPAPPSSSSQQQKQSSSSTCPGLRGLFLRACLLLPDPHNYLDLLHTQNRVISVLPPHRALALLANRSRTTLLSTSPSPTASQPLPPRPSFLLIAVFLLISI